jgi:hypothetical protein
MLAPLIIDMLITSLAMLVLGWSSNILHASTHADSGHRKVVGCSRLEYVTAPSASGLHSTQTASARELPHTGPRTTSRVA